MKHETLKREKLKGDTMKMREVERACVTFATAREKTMLWRRISRRDLVFGVGLMKENVIGVFERSSVVKKTI